LTNVYKLINDNTVDHQAVGAKIIAGCFSKERVAVAA